LAEKKKTCTRVKEQLIRDCAFEGELEVAVVDGRVAKVDGERVTESAYEWTGVGFKSQRFKCMWYILYIRLYLDLGLKDVGVGVARSQDCAERRLNKRANCDVER
jgi:hypothetical protein